MSYTKGEWEWWTSNSYKRLTAKTDGDVLHAYIASDGHPCIQVSKDDANLISAAPDLYEALKYARRFMDPRTFDTEFIDKALSKAQGE